MAGDIGRSFGTTAPGRMASPFTRNKQPTTVVIAITGCAAGNRVQLFTFGGTWVDRVDASSSGVATFYDLDDGTYVAYEVSTGNAWTAVVSGTSVTVTPIASSGTSGFAHFG